MAKHVRVAIYCINPNETDIPKKINHQKKYIYVGQVEFKETNQLYFCKFLVGGKGVKTAKNLGSFVLLYIYSLDSLDNPGMGSLVG